MGATVHFIKKFFRDIPTGVLMVLGFSILMFMIFNIVAVISNFEDRHSNNNYNQELSVLICSDTPIDYSELVVGNGNVYINNESAYIDEINMKTAVYGLVQYKEQPKKDLIYGEYPPLERKDKRPLAVVGQDIYKKATVIENERFITISGTEYLISGVLQKASAGNIDYTVIAFVDSVEEEKKTEYIKICTDNYTRYYCDYESDIYDFRNDIEALFNGLNSKGIDTGVLRERISSDIHSVNDSIDTFKKNTFILVVIFCLFNCFAITDLWLRNRYVELSIRKAYGYSTIQILFLLFKDILKYVLASMVLGYVMQLIYNSIKGINLVSESVLGDFLKALAAGFLIVIITVALQLSKVSRLAPANSVKEEV